MIFSQALLLLLFFSPLVLAQANVPVPKAGAGAGAPVQAPAPVVAPVVAPADDGTVQGGVAVPVPAGAKAPVAPKVPAPAAPKNPAPVPPKAGAGAAPAPVVVPPVAPGGGAAEVAAPGGQVPAVTAIQVPQTLANGQIKMVQTVFTQLFVNHPSQGPSPKQGVIGLGTLKGQVGATKTVAAAGVALRGGSEGMVEGLVIGIVGWLLAF
ncbi:MAG: hypothetical protein M1833_001140 [Piccolia ochrophora]|nr:MAG: hypothetical protein M1833_001140 [Piccolia ochrophora]